MPPLKRPDCQPPQTLECHITPEGSPEDGHHATATPLPNGTGEAGASPGPASYENRTVKGHYQRQWDTVFFWLQYVLETEMWFQKRNKKNKTLYLLVQVTMQQSWRCGECQKELCDTTGSVGCLCSFFVIKDILQKANKNCESPTPLKFNTDCST